MNSFNKTARWAGFLYLIYMLFHIFANIIGRSMLIVYGDAGATAQKIIACAGQFRIGIMIDLFGAVLFLIAAWALFVLLRKVNKKIALLFLLLNLSGVVIYSVSLIPQYTALLILNGSGYLNVFQTDQLQALAMLFLNIYKNGYMIAQFFFAIWIFPLGYLVFKSKFLPKILGIILMIHCFTWLSYVILFFLLPSFTGITYISFPLGFIAEFGLTMWLLIMGVKEPKPTLVC
jgi:hypothetical protein